MPEYIACPAAHSKNACMILDTYALWDIEVLEAREVVHPKVVYLKCYCVVQDI
jgi:hypothetical protein